MTLSRVLRAAPVAAVLLISAARSLGAVTVTPSAVYIDHRTRSSTITLYNTGTAPEDVTISFAFGYPRSDEKGEVSVPLFDAAPQGEPSAVEWLRAFPRRLVLQPGQRQVVRILATPPENLADGEYWARLIVTASGAEPPVEQRNPNGVAVQLSMRTQIINAVSYRKGAVATGVAVRRSELTRSADGAQLMLDLAREGNAAFLGRVRAQLVGPDGRTLAETEHTLAVYRELRVMVPFTVPGGNVPAGSTVRFSVDAVRPDLPQNGPLPARAVESSARLAG